jgi:phosphoribosylformylglycinamidine synthase
MLELKGAPALSDFRQQQLLARLRAVQPDIQGIQAHFVHFVNTDGPLNPSHMAVLEQLLGYGVQAGAETMPETGDGPCLWVTPRPGTISPWSTKATDIAHNCGLDQVLRIERGVCYRFSVLTGLPAPDLMVLGELLHDRMTETLWSEPLGEAQLFAHHTPAPLRLAPVSREGRAAIEAANQTLGLALSEDEMDYLVAGYQRLERDPTDVELMMFAQANSEHCRHKIFNASWTIDGKAKDRSLFAMIRNTHAQNPQGVLSAYKDNAAVIEGPVARRFWPDRQGVYQYHEAPAHILMKVETHNHPTGIAPFPGAATGSGGEIRDEGATGTGAKPKAGLTGFTTSHLSIPGYAQPWETGYGKPDRMASALDIMIEGPIGAAAFNNEFGRPNLCGYFRTFEMYESGQAGDVRGYHKPIMLAGGFGNILPEHVEKGVINEGDKLIVLGGPAMLIGLGGGAASSVASGEGDEALDFASVQRGNPEMERRCQEVIDRCWGMGKNNPIVFIHDVGAGGLSNALPELVSDAGKGGHFDLRKVLSDEPGMSPLEIWCNESQERYVLAVPARRLIEFEAICRRERCPYAVVGEATNARNLVVEDPHFGNRPVDVPLDLLLGKTPRMHRDVSSAPALDKPVDREGIRLNDAIERVLRFPAVASKSFLITIGDRSITGMVARDQMVGPWQVPVSDVAVTTSDLAGYTGEAMAMGERTPLALLDAGASARMAVAEAITNIMSADIPRLADIRLSANWMCAAGHPGEDARLYEAVEAIGMSFCTGLGICIPVGKDSMSMRTTWRDGEQDKSVTSPMSLIVSAFAPVADVRKTLTPWLRRDKGDTVLMLIDTAQGRNRLGGSVFAQVYGGLEQDAPDISPDRLVALFNLVQSLNQQGLLLACHDRSDGGLLACLAEMAFAGRCGLDIYLQEGDLPSQLFAEEIGAVIQVREGDTAIVRALADKLGLTDCVRTIARINDQDTLRILVDDQHIWSRRCRELEQIWAEPGARIQALRDNPDCARQAFEDILKDDPGLHLHLTYDPADSPGFPMVNQGAKPAVAILREQGVNGQTEMAAAFERAGFEAHDIHMDDIVRSGLRLEAFSGLVACGGFSYGDVLGAGEGWAKTILFNPGVRSMFEAFLNDQSRFALGVCNGCQMLANLMPLVAGERHWPRFVRNRSEQFEARVSMVEVQASRSIFLQGMQGSRLPIAVAHGEGRAAFGDPAGLGHLVAGAQVVLRYVDNTGQVTERYPANPNGSPEGLTGICSADGRITLMMPHPERVFRSIQNSWYPEGQGEDGAWMRMFRNARAWLG